MHLVERDSKFAMFWPPDQESVPIMLEAPIIPKIMLALST